MTVMPALIVDVIKERRLRAQKQAPAPQQQIKIMIKGIAMIQGPMFVVLMWQMSSL